MRNPTADSIRLWVSATRPRTLTAAIAPVSIGTAIAYGEGAFDLASAVAALGGALGIQISCNFANDLCDARKGADTHERLGPTRAVSSGLISQRAMLHATVIVLVLIVAPSVIFLVMRAGWPFLLLGALSVACSILYTAGRWSIAYHGWGELFAFAFFGPIAVAGTYAAQAGQWTALSGCAGIGCGCLAAALIAVNNLRDEPTDRAARKRTLAVRWGVAWARSEFLACIAAAALSVLALAACTGRWWCLLAVLSIIALVPSALRVRSGLCGRPLNEVLASTGRAILVYGVLVALGWNL